MAEEENTVINVQLEVDTKNLEKELTKAHQQAQKTAKAQVGSEKQSVASQKTASRIADTTRRDSNRDMANQTRSKRLAEQREERVRRAERGHEKESKKSFRERAKHYAETTKQRREEVRAAKQLRDIETDTVKRRNKQGAFASRGGGGASGGGGGSAAGGMGMGRMAVGAAGAVGGLAIAGIGAYIGAALTQLNDGVQLYKKYATSKADLTGMSGVERLENTDVVNRAAAMGFSKLDTAQQAGSIGRLTGHIGAVNTAQEFSRASGATFDQVGSTMGVLTRGGQGFDRAGDGAGRRQMALMFRDAVTGGLDRSRTGEHLEAVSSIIQNVGGRTSGDVNAGGISGLLAWLGSTGRSGFQGARGANFLSGIDQGISSGGVDDSAQAIALQAMGFGVGGSENTNYLDAVAQRERGIFGEGGAENLDAIMSRYQAGTGGGDAMIAEMRRGGHFGDASVDQLRAFRDEYNTAKQTGDGSGIANMLAEMEAAGTDIQTQILEATKGGNLEMVKHLAAMDNRSLEHGAALIQSVMQMEDLFNRLMDWGIPTMIDGINAIAAVALKIEAAIPGASQRAQDSSDRNLADFEKRAMGDLTVAERQRLLEEISTEQRVGVQNLTSRSADRATSRLSTLRNRLAQEEISSNPNSDIAIRERERMNPTRAINPFTGETARAGQRSAGAIEGASSQTNVRIQVVPPPVTGIPESLMRPVTVAPTTNQQTTPNGITWNAQ